MAKTDGPGRKKTLDDLGAWAHLHLWQIQPVRDVLLIFAFFGIIWAGQKASVVTVPLLLALMFAYLFEPAVRRYAKGNPTKRKVAAGGIILGVILFVGVPLSLGLVWAATSGLSLVVGFREDVVALRGLVDQAEDPTEEQLDRALPHNGLFQSAVPILRDLEAREKARQDKGAPAEESPDAGAGNHAADEGAHDAAPMRSDRERLLTVLDPVWAWASNAQNQQRLAKQAAVRGLDALTVFVNGATTVGKVVFGAFLTAFFFFFICVGYHGVLEFLRDMIPDKVRPRAMHLIGRMDRVVAGFVRGRLTICAVLSVLFTIGYVIIGVPMPVVLGLTTGLLSIVPYLALVNVPVAIVLMLLNHPEGLRGEVWWMIGAPIALYFAIQWTDDYIWTPRIQGKHTDMDTPSILFATLAGAALLGVYGLLIAIPLAACAKILWIEVALPRIKQWKEGRASDPLPLGGGEDGGGGKG